MRSDFQVCNNQDAHPRSVFELVPRKERWQGAKIIKTIRVQELMATGTRKKEVRLPSLPAAIMN
jgi:hypothetical protein